MANRDCNRPQVGELASVELLLGPQADGLDQYSSPKIQPREIRDIRLAPDDRRIGSGGQNGTRFIAQASQLGVMGIVLFHPEHCLLEPVLGLFLFAELGVSHGLKDVIEGGASLG
jgi:hypothetical protein